MCPCLAKKNLGASECSGMPRSSSREGARTNVQVNKAKKRGGDVRPTASFKSSTKQTPSVSKKSAMAASENAASATTADALRKPPVAVPTPQLWLMKTDPDYMVSLRVAWRDFAVAFLWRRDTSCLRLTSS